MRLLLLLLGLVLCSAPARAAQSVTQSMLDWVTPGASAAQAQTARRRLIERGPAAVSELFELASGQRTLVPKGTPPPVDQAVLVERVAELFGAWEEASVMAALEPLLGDEARLNDRLTATRILGSCGKGRAFECILRMAAPLPQAQLRHPRIADVIGDASALIFQRHPYAAQRVVEKQDELPPDLLRILALAAGEAPHEYTFRILESFALRQPKLHATVLEAVRTWPRWLPECTAGRSADLVVEFLASPDCRLRKRAATALGALDPARSADLLLDCLSDPDREVQAAARRSLAQLIGKDLGGDPAAWNQWFDAEQAWWNARSTEALSAIAGSDRAAAVRAFQELSAHPLFGPGTWSAVAALAVDRDSAIAVAACGALARMDAAAAIPDLVAATGNGRLRVATTASAALAQITRRPAPAEPHQWAELLGL